MLDFGKEVFPGLLVEAAEGALELAGACNDIAASAGVDGANGNDCWLEGVSLAGDEGLEFDQYGGAGESGIVGEVGAGGMARIAGHRDCPIVSGGGLGPWGNVDGAGGLLRSDVEAESIVDVFQATLSNEDAGACANLFRLLEGKLDRTGQLVLAAVEDADGAKEGGAVGIVATSVAEAFIL